MELHCKLKIANFKSQIVTLTAKFEIFDFKFSFCNSF